MFILAGAAAGASASEKLRRELEVCRAAGTLLRHTYAMIRGTGMDLYRLSAELKRTDGLESLGFVSELPEHFSPDEDYRRVWRSLVEKDRIPPEEKRLLLSLGEELGSTDIKGQLAAIAVLEEQLRETESKRREELSKRTRLYCCAGTLFGAMAGILVI